MREADQRKQAIRHEIMNVVKANSIPVTEELWLALAFRAEAELKIIASDIHKFIN